jgi:hypothetical protein
MVFSPKHGFIMPYPDSFVDTVSVHIPQTWYEPDYTTDPRNIPDAAIEALKIEKDFDIAMQQRKGVMFDLMKQVCGCYFPNTTHVNINEKTQEVETSVRKGKEYAPKPQYYQYFAYTAYALLHGDVTELNWRIPYDGNIQGQDVMYAINKYGIYGLTEKVNAKKIMVSKFAALYARMYNSDFRFQQHAAEPAELKIAERESPLTYCSDCGIIRIAWDIHKKAYKPGDPEYKDLLARFKRQIMQKEFEKQTAEDQERYLQKRGTLLNLDLFDLQRYAPLPATVYTNNRQTDLEISSETGTSSAEASQEANLGLHGRGHSF